MKLKYFLPVLAFGLLVLQGCSDDDDGLKNVPETIKSAFNQKYPGKSVREWEKKSGYYVAEFSNDNRSADAWFTPSGSWVRTETDYIGALPTAVSDYISQNYPIAVIDDQDWIETPTDQYFEIELEQRKKKDVKAFLASEPHQFEYYSDIVSTNYLENFWDEDHKKYPQLMFMAGELAVGETKIITYTYVVQEDDAGETITNTVIVEAEGANGTDTTSDDTAVTDVEDRYDVTTSINRGTITGGGTYDAGEDVTITFEPARNWYVDSVTVNGERHDYAWDRTEGAYVLTIEDIDADYDVVVVCEYDDDEGGGGSPSEPDDGDDDDDTTDIEDEDVPLAGDVQLNDIDHFAYIKGYEDGTVRPTNNITREEVATIFYRLLTDTSRAIYFTEANTFSDVDSSNWSNKAISTLANAGIITGYPDGTFRPQENITRAEFAAIAARFSVVTENVASPFTDTAGHWAESLIAFAADLGWVTGYPDNTFRPEQDITRAEAMTLINNVLDREVDAEGLLANAKQWVDNVPGTWYYYEVLEATNSHDYERRVEGEVLENWTALNPDPVWDE